jgi:hypothetical protein
MLRANGCTCSVWPAPRDGARKVELEIDGKVAAHTRKHECQTNHKELQPKALQRISPCVLSRMKTSHLPDGIAVQMPADTFLDTVTRPDLLTQPLPAGAALSNNISSRVSLHNFAGAIAA